MGHGDPASFEAKWSKVSASGADFYREYLDYFFDADELSFRALVVQDKSRLRHPDFGQTHDDWYYKMYYQTLAPLIRLGYVRMLWMAVPYFVVMTLVGLGALAGGIKTTKVEAQTVISLVNTRTSEEEYNIEGFAKKSDFSFGAGGFDSLGRLLQIVGRRPGQHLRLERCCHPSPLRETTASATAARP